MCFSYNDQIKHLINPHPLPWTPRHKPGGLPVDLAMLQSCMDLAKSKAKERGRARAVV